jgi:hypothetical protein
MQGSCATQTNSSNDGCICSRTATSCSAWPHTRNLGASQQRMAAHAGQLANLCTSTSTAGSAGLWDAAPDRHAHGCVQAPCSFAQRSCRSCPQHQSSTANTTSDRLMHAPTTAGPLMMAHLQSLGSTAQALSVSCAEGAAVGFLGICTSWFLIDRLGALMLAAGCSENVAWSASPDPITAACSWVAGTAGLESPGHAV